MNSLTTHYRRSQLIALPVTERAQEPEPQPVRETRPVRNFYVGTNDPRVILCLTRQAEELESRGLYRRAATVWMAAFRESHSQPERNNFLARREPQYPVAFRAWAKVIQTSATTWQETAQIGDAITHYITIRYRRGITADYEVVCDDSVYRVKRQRDLNGARRFLLLECTELGAEEQMGGRSGADSIFTR